MENIGGRIIFIIIILSTILTVLFAIYFLNQRSKFKTIDKLIEQGEKAINDPNSGITGIIDESSNTSMFNRGIQHQLQSRNFQFIDRDMYQHFCRIYFLGSNKADSAWNLPLNPPASLRSKVKLERFAEFATAINE